MCTTEHMRTFQGGDKQACGEYPETCFSMLQVALCSVAEPIRNAPSQRVQIAPDYNHTSYRGRCFSSARIWLPFSSCTEFTSVECAAWRLHV